MTQGSDMLRAHTELLRRARRKVWDASSFLEEFCSHIADGGGSAGSLDVNGSLAHFVGALEYILTSGVEGGFDAGLFSRCSADLRRVVESITSRIGFYRKLASFEQWNSDYHFQRLVQEVASIVDRLEVGDMLLLPFRAASGPAVLLLESVAEHHVDLTVINPSPYATMHRKTIAVQPHTATNTMELPTTSSKEGTICGVCVGSAKMVQNIALRFGRTRRSRMSSEVFWMFLLGKVHNSDDALYQHLFSWVTERDFEGSVSEHLPTATYATPSKSSGLWKALVHTLRHILTTRCELDVAEGKHVRFFLRKYFIPLVETELASAQKITLTQKKLIEAALGTYSLAATRANSLCSHALLDSVRSSVERIRTALTNLPVKGESSNHNESLQPKLDVSSHWDRAQQVDIHPLFDLFRRYDSVDEFVGVKEEQTKATPINMFRIPERVESIGEAIVALTDMVQLLVRVVAHANSLAVKNAPFLVVAAVSHFVVEILPKPATGASHATTTTTTCPATTIKSTIWDTPLLYAQQVSLLSKLEDVGLLFHWASKSADDHRDQDAVHMVVLGTLAAISDRVIRVPALDITSTVTLHLNGAHYLQVEKDGSPSGGFSVSSGDFARQSEMATFTYPEALFARTAVLDYFDELVRSHPAANVVLKLDEGPQGKEVALSKLMRQLAASESFPPLSHPAALGYAVECDGGLESYLNRFYPEFQHWRNSMVLFKASMSQTGGASSNTTLFSSLPERPSCSTANAVLYYTLTRDMSKKVRYPSDADPKGYVNTSKDTALTEDDLLHIQNLPVFGILGQRDVELLLSFLTAPYLRIPLLLRFFATEDRVSSLDDPTLRVLLHGVLFEPGRFLTITNANECPREVPCDNPQLIATPYGLLMSELQHSPEGVIEPLLRLLRLAKEMDAGTVFNESVTQVIFALLRFVATIESYVFAILHHSGRRAMHVDGDDRSFVVGDEEYAYLKNALRDIRTIIRDELLPMLDSWIDELDDALARNELPNLDPSTASSMLCGLYQHQVILLRNVEPSAYDFDFVSRLLAAFAFLTTRFVWGRHVHFNEHHIYLVLQQHRRGIAKWMYSRTSEELGAVMNAVVRVATGNGKRCDPTAVNYPWAFVAGRECAGRFTRADPEVLSRQQAKKGKLELIDDLRKTLWQVPMATTVARSAQGENADDEQQQPPSSLPLQSDRASGSGAQQSYVCESTPTIFAGQHDVEVSIHSGCLTFRAAFLKAIPQAIAGDADVRELFDHQLRKTRIQPEALQCAIVEEATNRTWIQLVGLEHDIQYWKTPDPRVPIPSDSMRFYPDDCEETEQWIAPIFELYRRVFFTRSFFQPPILILLPEDKLTTDASVAFLTAVCSATGEKLKEIYVFRDLKVVQVFDTVSHGRRFYRQHVFSSDSILSLAELADVGCGGDATADKSHAASTSAVILRKPTHPDNVSRSLETYLPSRFLVGLLPDALIETHRFWQDEDDNIRGYPTEKKAVHLLWLHWKDLRYAPLGGKYVGVQVVRFAIAAAAPRASERAVLHSQRLELKDEIEDVLGMTRAHTNTSSSMGGDADEEDGGTHHRSRETAGMYRQSSVTYTAKTDSATVEEHHLLLLNLMYARHGTPLHSLAATLSRLEPLAHILVWTTQVEYDTTAGGPATLDLIYLPRLKLSFRAKLCSEVGDGEDSTTYVIQSLDHAHLFVSNLRPGPVMEMTQGIPHSLILADVHGAITILVPRFSVRRADSRSSFSVDVVVERFSAPNWYLDRDTRYYLFPVHVSQSFLFTPSYESAVYLLLLRYLRRNYEETFRLIASVGTDEVLEYDIASTLHAIASIRDEHPDAVACMCRLTLYIGSSSSINLPWKASHLVARHILLQSRTSVCCLMPPDEERRLLQVATDMERQVDIMRDVLKQNVELLDPRTGRYRAIREVRHLAGVAIREKLGVRVGDVKIDGIMAYAREIPIDAFSRCLLFNRYELLRAEHEMLLTSAAASTTAGTATSALNELGGRVLKLEVPKIPADERFHFYRGYDPTSISTQPPVKLVNDQGKPVTCSTSHDYYYCGAITREYPCRCGLHCRDLCGGNNRNGCPCLSCERFNNLHRDTLRLLPSVDYKNAGRTMPFMEMHSILRSLMSQRAQRLKREERGEVGYRSEAPHLRDANFGFYLLYEWITGTRTCRIGKRHVGRDLVQLLLPLYYDGRMPASALSHMMQFIAHLTKEQIGQLPMYPKKGRGLDLADVHQALVNLIAEEAAEGRSYPLPPSVDRMPKYTAAEDRDNTGIRLVMFRPRRLTRDASIPLAETRILPSPHDAECAVQVLTVPSVQHLELHGEERLALQVSEEQVAELCHWPLASVLSAAGGTDIVVHQTREELQLAVVPEALPFDLSQHPDSRLSVARDMLQRLKHEMQTFADRSNTAKLPRIAGLTSETSVRQLLLTQQQHNNSTTPGTTRAAAPASPPPLSLAVIVKRLEGLNRELNRARKEDNRYVAYANAAILRTANFYRHESQDGMLLLLRSFAGREATLRLEYLLSSLCSTRCLDEWRQLNPFLSAEGAEAMRQSLIVSVLRANRVGHINRVLEVLRELLLLLRRVQAAQESHSDPLVMHGDALVTSISQKADTLAGMLMVKKCFFSDPADGEQQQQSVKFSRTFDPRHLLFEFTWNLVMRRRQYELVLDMYRAIASGSSVVKQMIMGAGKTTVVGPVLGLMLANGRQLIVQVVPPALLDFTRAVLRTTFSSILQKQIFTFLCDRTTTIDSDVTMKFDEAIRSRGIVVTTPSSVKSLFLKCVEACRRYAELCSKSELSGAGKNSTTTTSTTSMAVNHGGSEQHRLFAYREARDHLRVLSMWHDAVLVMDEVDMLLHPLKSELNFPIGAKAELDYIPLRWKLPVHLLDAIYFYHTRRLSTHLRESPEAGSILARFRAAIAEGLACNALQEMPHIILLDLGYYDRVLKPILVEWLLLFIQSQHYVGLSLEETREYLFRRPTKEKQPEIVAKIEALDQDHIKMLNLSFEWMSSYLPHILQKIDRVTFGIMTQAEYYQHQDCGESRSRLVTAIPFVGKDMPSPSSEFAHPDIVIGLTILAYRYEGLRETDFHAIVQEIFAAVDREVGRFSQRRTTLLYNKWVAAAGGSLLTTYDYQAVREAFNESLEVGMQPTESMMLTGDPLDDDDNGGYGSDDDDVHRHEQSHFVRRGKRLIYSSGGGRRHGTKSNKDDPNALTPIHQRQVLPLKLMKQANELEMKKLFRLLRRTPEVIHWYLCELIFPEHMRHQEVKLSASGQELGGDVLFRRRIGFSGTPSSLLPIELGSCEYEVGTDGQLIHTLTSPDIMSLTVFESGWNVRGLLNYVASAVPPFHALIDTGALITGMSNLQVAQYLLKYGLPQMEGVVYLDEGDRKMILVRATGRSLLLSECGIPKVKRFTFYDQIHTTGMDVEHTPNAQAVQTLGKDMTFRDFSQGAYRMRGIGNGQRIHLLIIPEVRDLIQNVLQSCTVANDMTTTGAAPDADRRLLVGVSAWLLMNSIRSEHIQNNQLRVQCCANVWRKAAFRQLELQMQTPPSPTIVKPAATETTTTTTTTADDGVSPKSTTTPHAESCGTMSICDTIAVFDEALDYTVVKHVPQPRLFSEMLNEFVSGHQAFIHPHGRQVIDAIIDGARREDEMEAPVIDVEMVQEQEEEREREEQKEEEHEIEIEKYVDLDYSREHESSVPWLFQTLRSVETASTQFYPLRSFHLFKRSPLEFPDYIYLSRNYYSTLWSGYRRIKNVVVTMEWLPDADVERHPPQPQPSLDYANLCEGDSQAALRRTLSILLSHQLHNQTAATTAEATGRSAADRQAVIRATLRAFLVTALQYSPESLVKEWDDVVSSLVCDVAGLARGSETNGKQQDDQHEDEAAIVTALATRVHDILRSNALRHEESGRYTVALTLAEAETTRRILHFHKARHTPLIPGARTELALRVVPCDNALLDRSASFLATTTPYQPQKAYQCLRYFDGELQYSDHEVGLLLRALQVNPQGHRKRFFHQTISCRRRARQRWERAPISLLFLLQSAFVLLHQRTLGICMRLDLTDTHKLALGDAFVAFNASGSGVLSAEEVWGAMRFCRLDLDAEDVLDFIDMADAQREGTVQYPDFLYMLSGSREAADGDDGADEQQAAKNLPTVTPYGGAEITAARAARNIRLRLEEEASAQQLAHEEQLVLEEMERESIRQELDVLQTFPNPKLETDRVRFDFATESQVAQLVSTVGAAVARRKRDAVSGNVDSCMLTSDAALRLSLKGLLSLLNETDGMNPRLRALTSFTTTVEFCIPKAASWESQGKKRTEHALVNVSIELLQWQLPYHYLGSSTRTPIERTIAAQLKKRQRAAEGLPDDEDDEDGEPADGAKKNARGGAAAAAANKDIPGPMIFSSAVPSADGFLGYLKVPSDAAFVIMSPSTKRQSVIVSESTYEFGLLADDRFPVGWICCKHNQEEHVHPLLAKVVMASESLKLEVTTGELPGPPYGRILDSSRNLEKEARMSQFTYYHGHDGGDDDGDCGDNGDDSDDEGSDGGGGPSGECDDMPSGSRDGNPRVYGDIEDLMIAIRKLRTLEKGDRVKRHPTYWQHGEEDGGEGTVGKVTSVGFDECDVTWPNQNKTTCSWGKAGVFELVKAERDPDAVDRKPDNDERHRELVDEELNNTKAKKQQNCSGCQTRFPSIMELFVCNECPKQVFLCKQCFLDGAHEMHEFTELQALVPKRKEESDDEEGSDSEATSSDDGGGGDGSSTSEAKKSKKKEKREKKKKDDKSDDEDAAIIQSLFGDWGGEVAVADHPLAAAKAGDGVAGAAATASKPKKELPPPIDPVILPKEISDGLKEYTPATSSSSSSRATSEATFTLPHYFSPGGWVRTLVRMPPTVSRNQLGFIVHGVNATHASVAFLSEFVNDAKTHVRQVPYRDLVPVARYVDRNSGKPMPSLYLPCTALQSVYQAAFAPSLSLLCRAAATRSRYQIGDCVVGESQSESQPFFATVAAVLPGRKYLIVPHTVPRRMVLHESALAPTFFRGAVVRVRRDVQYPAFGWPAGLSVAHRYTTEFRVTSQGSKGGRCMLTLESSSAGSTMKFDALGSELEVAEQAKWVIYRRQPTSAQPSASDRPAQDWDLLPNSCKIIIDRAHSEGKRLVRFIFAKQTYRAEFPSQLLYAEGAKAATSAAADGSSSSSGSGVVVGTLHRFPTLPWSRPKRTLMLDDGAWHLLTFSLTGNSVTALCDTEPMPVDLDGILHDVCSKQRAKTDLSLEAIALAKSTKGRPRTVKKKKAGGGTASAQQQEEEDDLFGMGLFDDDDGTPPAPAPSKAAAKSQTESSKSNYHHTIVGLVEEDYDDEADDAEDNNNNTPGAEEPRTSDASAGDSKSISELHAFLLSRPLMVLSSERSDSMRLLTFPQRFITTCDIRWGTVNPQHIRELHLEVSKQTVWKCTECAHLNPRNYLTCDECAVPRRVAVVNRMLDSRPERRFRYAMLRSKEASQLRNKLGNKLRALFQAQLDEAQMAAAGGHSQLASAAAQNDAHLYDAL